MKKIFSAVLGGCLLLGACAATEQKTITIKGKVQFPDNSFNMEIVERNGFDKTIIDSCKVNEDGTYRFTMKVDRPGVYTLDCQKWQSVQFWAEDEDLEIDFRGMDTARIKIKNSPYVYINGGPNNEVMNLMNWDSYLGRTGHNYFLYEEDGILRILPWDYNLSFGTYALGMTDPVKDPNILINYPINTPAEGEVMLNRPLYHNLMKHDEYFARYHAYFDKLLSEYFESGRFAVTLRQTAKQIAPYVQKDPTAFCSYEDHQLAVDTLEEVCLLRAESIRGQLDGEIPAAIRGQQENPDAKVDASVVKLTDLGDFEDLESAKERQDAALRDITGKST